MLELLLRPGQTCLRSLIWFASLAATHLQPGVKVMSSRAMLPPSFPPTVASHTSRAALPAKLIDICYLEKTYWVNRSIVKSVMN